MTILVSISVVTTLLTSVVFILGAVNGSSTFFVVSNFFISIDGFVNALCFMLQFSFNKKYYFFICRCCHIQCQSCVVSKKMREQEASRLSQMQAQKKAQGTTEIEPHQ